VAFLKQLLRHIPGKLLLVWDRLPVHRSRLVREFVAAQKGRINIEYLQAYTPALSAGSPIAYFDSLGLPRLFDGRA
jgi:DDE superfamily endonuclease